MPGFPLHLVKNADFGMRFRRDGGTNNPLLQINLAESDSSVDLSASGSTVGPMKFTSGSTERMRIENGTAVLFSSASETLTKRRNPAGWNIEGASIGGTTTGSIIGCTDGEHHRLGRKQDGTILAILSGGSEEGTISVSGTTVSYNGGHLARFSRLTSGNKDTSIVKGTVLTNLDQMVVWSYDAVPATYYEEGDILDVISPPVYYDEHDTLPEGKKVGDIKIPEVTYQVGDEKTPAIEAYTEQNEQLNCMAVSSVEGDPNVAGVFVNWDDKDDFNDMNVAMTGDMVIRIAQGTTVARGDLLMSAGDGTAKPQGDDIIRSKTIAKVTSTNVSHTYDDGSYLVPCVLMAC